MPYSLRPPAFSRGSKIVLSTPAMASSCAQASPAGPAPTIATRFPVGAARVRGPPSRDCGFGRIALQSADHDRLCLRRLAHAGFFAERFGRADAGAYAAHDVGIENRRRRARAVAGGDLANEQRDVDGGRAGLLAGRIEAEIAALRLHSG